MIDDRGLDVLIQVDGGVETLNASRLVRTRVNVPCSR